MSNTIVFTLQLLYMGKFHQDRRKAVLQMVFMSLTSWLDGGPEWAVPEGTDAWDGEGLLSIEGELLARESNCVNTVCFKARRFKKVKQGMITIF